MLVLLGPSIQSSRIRLVASGLSHPGTLMGSTIIQITKGRNCMQNNPAIDSVGLQLELPNYVRRAKLAAPSLASRNVTRSDIPELARRAADAKLVLFRDRKSTRLNSSHVKISYAVICSKTKIY